MTTAATKVLDTPELLEAVLPQLPPRELLLAQRVNTAFKAVIDRSIHIQRKLFFKPNVVRSGSDTDMPAINPFLLQIICYMKGDSKGCLHNTSYEGAPHHPTVITIHNEGKHSGLDKDNGCDAAVVRVVDAVWEGTHMVFIHNAHPMPKSRIPDGSWRKMLVSDPQICEFRAYPYLGPMLGSIIPGSTAELVDFLIKRKAAWVGW